MPKYQNHPNAVELIPKDFRIKIGSRQLFKSMGAVLAAAADGKIGSMTQSLLESVTTVNATEKAAYSLVFNALNNASVNLLKQHHQEKIDNLKLRGNFELLRSQVSEDIQELEIVLSPDIFSNPSGFPFLKKYQQIWLEWLQLENGLHLDVAQAHKLAKEIPCQFEKAIEKQWLEFPDKYQVIIQHFTDNPFSENAESRETVRKYKKQIENLWTANIFKEKNLTLEKTYIQPNFKISKRNLDKNKDSHTFRETDRNAAFIAPDYAKNIHSYINNCFLKNQNAFADRVEAENSRLLLLLGQPGQGKTSFCTKVVNDILNDLTFERDLIFLKLRDLKCPPREFINHIFENLEKQFEKHLFDYDNAVIILDGLDELYMAEGLTNIEITDFINNLVREVKHRTNIHVIVTSRFHYVDLTKISKKDALVLSLSPLTLEQQKDWLNIYRTEYPEGKLTEELLTEINEEGNKQFKEIRELINQPILLYLIAKADFEIKSSDNRAKIYDELFTVMTQRTWDNTGQLEKFEGLEENPEDFREYLGAVAFKIYNSNKEFITSEELNAMEETKRFVEDCGFEDVESALKEVLVSFYFRPIEDADTSPRDRRYSVEFFHKSLQEYLAAEYIWRTVLYEFTKKDDRKRRHVIDKWEEGLELIWNLGSPYGLTRETSTYLRELINNSDELERKEDLSQRLKLFMPDYLKHDFVYFYQAQREDLGSVIARGVESFYLFWTIFSEVRDDEIIDFGMYKNQFVDLVHFKIRNNDDYLKLERLDLLFSDFTGLHLVNVDFSYSLLEGSDFNGAHLSYSKFFKADLLNCDFSRCLIEDTDFSYAGLSRTDFSYSVNNSVNFSKIKATEIDFSEAHIENCNFNHVNLDGGSFNNSKGRRCSFISSELYHVKMGWSKFESFEFSNSRISDTDFSNSDLHFSYLDNMVIHNCDFINTNLEQCTFSDSEIEDVDFNSANLLYADFTGTEIEDNYFHSSLNKETIKK